MASPSADVARALTIAESGAEAGLRPRSNVPRANSRHGTNGAHGPVLFGSIGRN